MEISQKSFWVIFEETVLVLNNTRFLCILGTVEVPLKDTQTIVE